MNPVLCRECTQKSQEFNQTLIRRWSTQEINWSVRNLNSLPKDAGYSIDSRSFVLQDATWCLRLYPNCGTEGSVRFIGLTIVRLSSRVPRHTLMYHVKSVMAEKVICCESADFDEDHTERGDMEFIYRFHCGMPFNPDSINVVCQVSCYVSHAVDAVSQTELSIHYVKDVEAVCQHFKTMLLNGQDHDVVLKVKDEEFRAHRNILRARSSVLESMLGHDMVEKNSGAIDIPDCDPSAFEQFLMYLYSGRVETLDKDNMLSLYYIGDKYGVEPLKEVCRQFARESLSTVNVTDVVQTALDHGDADLLRWSTDYFVKEVDAILPTVEWLSFMKRNTVQANELFIKSRKNN